MDAVLASSLFLNEKTAYPQTLSKKEGPGEPGQDLIRKFAGRGKPKYRNEPG